MSRTASPPSGPRRFAFVTEIDISIDDGPGINEREFIAAVGSLWPGEVISVVPRPSRPDVIPPESDTLRFAPAHEGRPAGYARYLRGAYRIVRALQEEAAVGPLAFRLGGTPLLPYALHRRTGAPIILKKLALYAVFGEDSARSAAKTAVSRGLLGLYRTVVRACVFADTESRGYPPWLSERFGIGGDRLAVIPNGANTELFRPADRVAARRRLGLGAHEFVVGYVGALSRLRNVDSLIRVMTRLEDLRPFLLLAGAGAESAALADLARACGVADRVRFVGRVPYDGVPDLVRAMDVAVDPTLVPLRTRSGITFASYSQKIAQYLACGVPVVAWDCPDTEFLAREGVGALARHPDEDSLAAAVHSMRPLSEKAADAARRDRCVQVARRDLCSMRLAERRMQHWRAARDAAEAEGDVGRATRVGPQHAWSRSA